MTRYAEARISHPNRHYETPDLVLRDDKLSLEEKEKVLRSMADEAEQLIDASAEGMARPAPSYQAEDLRRSLIELDKAKERAAATDHHPFQSVVVVTTVDRDLNHAVTKVAMDLSRISHGRISLLNILPDALDGAGLATAAPMAAGIPHVAADQAQFIDERTDLLMELRRDSGAGEDTSIEVRTGPLEETIVNYAEEIGADVIVVGSPNRSWLERLFNPSVARNVTRSATCPVLVVPGPG